MKNLYHYLLLTFLAVFVQAGFAQTNGQLTGNLKDDQGAAIGFGTVAVLQASNAAIITGGVTDADGKFQIKTPAAGDYILRLTAIGYTATDTPPFKVTGAEFGHDFGSLVLKADTKTLQEVKVQALRPTITNHADKMVVSVENTALAAGSTAYEVLAKSPGVFIDQDGNIQLNGKGGIRIMIDGKLTYLSGKELQTLLQGMSAENLKALEIITNPSAKYDAEGTAGIININLKKNEIVGLNGSVYAGYQYNGLHGYTSGGNINYKKGNWNSFANLDVARRTNIRTNTMTREFNSEGSSVHFDQVGREEGRRFIPSLRLGTDYDISKKHSVGVMANLMHFRADNEFLTTSYLTNGNPLEDSLIKATNQIAGRFNNGTFNAHYMGKLDSLGTTLSADLDYVALRDNRNSRFTNELQRVSESRPMTTEISTSYNPPRFDIYSAKIDFIRPLNKETKFELGAKASYVISDSDLQFYDILNEQEEVDPRRTSHFIYKENVYAAYVNFNTSWGEKWSLQSGLRAEQTNGEGRLVNNNTVNTRRYLDLFPSIFVSQKVNKDYQLTYNYSRRINRPRYESMNPFFFYLDKYTSAQGNPDLKPQYTNSFEVKQIVKNTYNLVVGYAVTQNFIAEIPEQNNENNTTVFKHRNVREFKNISANLILPVKISSKWDVSNNVSLSHQDYTIELQNQSLRNEQLFLYAQSTSNIQLPKNLRLELSAAYQGQSAYGLYTIAANWGLDAGLKRTFLDNKLDLSVNVTDIFRTRRIIGTANFNGNVNEFDQYHFQQSARINLRYRFNKGKQFDAKRRTNSLEELNRAGGN